MVTSATTGLLCASMVAKIKPGEKFAVSAYTQAATCNGAIFHLSPSSTPTKSHFNLKVCLLLR